MGTHIKNDGLAIDFEVKEILQSDLEAYEHEVSRYLQDSESEGKEQSIVVSAIVRGACDANWIPSDVLIKSDIEKSKPAKIYFLAARIAEAIDLARTIPKDFSMDYDVPEILQGDLEKYEKARNSLVAKLEISIYETALMNSTLVRASIRTGWISKDILSEENIGSSHPYTIKYLANLITEALIDARTISGE